MKSVILAGCLGARISEETSRRPKPMVEIGYKSIQSYWATDSNKKTGWLLNIPELLPIKCSGRLLVEHLQFEFATTDSKHNL